MHSLSKPRILIADHDQTFLDQLADRLLQRQMEVDFAQSGKTAMKLVESETYDLIIVEIAMPIYNGLEILRKVKATNPDTPILIMSYEITQDWADQAMREGAYKYLLRPLEDITKFDLAVREGLELAPVKQPQPEVQSPLSQEIFESLPQTQVRSPFEEDEFKTESQAEIAFESHTPPFEAPSSLAQQGGVSPEKAPWEQLQEETLSLAEGMIELNEQGQIVSCSVPARKWLMLESKSQEKPIKKLIKTLGKRNVPEHLRVQIGDHQVHLTTKTIQDRAGSTRYILVIRESRVAAGRIDRTEGMRIPINQPAAQKPQEKKNAFNSSLQKYRAEPQTRGFSPLGLFDQMKTTIKDEVEKLKEQNPLERFSSQPEEADPEMVFTMSRRISDVSRGRRTSF
jgi:DNA-binding NarL/FixJ family response regulator